MIFPIIRELIEACRPVKLGKGQREKVYGLMRQLREYGFTNKELSMLVKGKIPTASIKRHTSGVEVRDVTEHDQVIEALSGFVSMGYDLNDLRGYKEAKAVLDGEGLEFDQCAKMVSNLRAVGTSLQGLLDLSEEMKAQRLKVESVRANIDLNEELEKRGIDKEAQRKILDAAEKYGDPAKILEALSVFGDITKLRKELLDIDKMCEEADRLLSNKTAEMTKIDADVQRYKTWVDIVKLLMVDYHFDYSSLNTLLTLAKRHGNPLQVIEAVNTYANLEEMHKKVIESETSLKMLEGKITESQAKLEQYDGWIEEANRLIGEIKVKHEQSFYLQLVSSLLTKPRERMRDPDELARITVALLNGVAENTKANPQASPKFLSKVKLDIEPTIASLQDFLRG